MKTYGIFSHVHPPATTLGRRAWKQVFDGVFDEEMVVHDHGLPPLTGGWERTNAR